MPRRLTDEEARPVMLAAGLEPLELYPGSGQPWLCKCGKCGETVTPRFASIQRGNGGCLQCGFEVTASKRRTNFTATCHPERRALAKGLCSACYRQSKKIWDKCKCGGVKDTRSVTCSSCASVLPRPKRLVDDDIMGIMLNSQLEPLVPYPGYEVPWLCRCMICGAQVQPRYHSIKMGQGGCKPCGVRKRTTARRLSDDEARWVMRGAGLEPLDLYPGTVDIHWPSQCKTCGSFVSPTYHQIKSGIGGGCRVCGYRKRTESAREVNSSIAVELMLRSGLHPIEPYVNSGTPWKCKCINCDRTVTPTYDNVKAGQSPCRYCATRLKGGISSGDPAFVYLITHSIFQAIKIGIGRESRLRSVQHQRHGWDILKEWGNVLGSVAMAAETRVLRNWRKAGIPVACTKEQMPQGGWTETAPLDMVDIAKVRRWVNYEIRRSRERENA